MLANRQFANCQHMPEGVGFKVEIDLLIRSFLRFVAQIVELLSIDGLQAYIRELSLAYVRIEQGPRRGENSPQKSVTNRRVLSVDIPAQWRASFLLRGSRDLDLAAVGHDLLGS